VGEENASFDATQRLTRIADSFFRIASSVNTKGFLGRSLGEHEGYPSVGVSAARRSGVIVDDAGKMRCPPGTPNANQFTDINMSNCAVPSAETVARQAADAASEIAKKSIDGFRRSSFTKKPKTRESIPHAKVAFADNDGFLEQRRIPVGNQVVSPSDGSIRTLSSVDDSIKHVSEGGALSDIPDEHLIRAIIGNVDQANSDTTKRFQQVGHGGGVNGMLRLKDKRTGALLGVKYHDLGSSQTMRPAGVEAKNEALSELLLEHMGFEPMPMRLVPVTENRTYSWGDMESALHVGLVTELAHNRHNGAIESARIDERTGPGYNYNADIESQVRMGVLDLVLGNRDRHEGNFLIARDGNNPGEFIPIDHSIVMEYGGEPTSLESLMPPLLHLETDQSVSKMIIDGKRDEVVNMVAKVQENLRGIEIDKLKQGSENIFSHLASMGFGASPDEKKKFDHLLASIEIAKNSTPDELVEKMFPKWKVDLYKKQLEQSGVIQQPIMDLAALANRSGGPVGNIDL